jgi:hypothetical protein
MGATQNFLFSALVGLALFCADNDMESGRAFEVD